MLTEVASIWGVLDSSVSPFEASWHLPKYVPHATKWSIPQRTRPCYYKERNILGVMRLK
jgi:hypothetical protein